MFGLISLEWEKCPEGYTVETLQMGCIRFEVEKCDGDSKWQLLAYPSDDAPDWLRETMIDDPHENWCANGAIFEGYEFSVRAAEQLNQVSTLVRGNQYIVPQSNKIISHTAIENSPGAFMEFADCAESPDNTARFVSMYGYPTKVEEIAIDQDVIPGTNIVTFTWFQELASYMCEAIDGWERAKKTGDYRKLKILLEQATFLDTGDTDFDDIEINEPLAQLNVGLQLPTTRNALPTLSILPPDLETALWLQFAIAVADAPEIRKCEECPTWFEVTPGKGRPEKRYCSSACSMRAYRKRVKAKKQNG